MELVAQGGSTEQELEEKVKKNMKADKELLLKTVPLKWHKRPKFYTILLILLAVKIMLITTLLYRDTIAQSFAGHDSKLIKYYAQLRLDTRNGKFFFEN